MKTKVEFESNVYELEIDGKTYAIAERTAETEKKIAERDSELKARSEYESNMALLNILLGEKAVKEIFPDGENENLDKIAKIAYYALKYYYHDKNEFDKSIIKEKAEKLKQNIRAIGDKK